MKKIATLSFITLVALSSCKKKVINPIKAETTFDIVSEEEIYIRDAYRQMPFLNYNPGPFAPGVKLPIPLPDKGYQTNYQQYLTQYNTSVDKIKKTEVIESSIEVISPSTENMNYFDSIKMYMYTRALPTPQLVAYKDSIPDGSKKGLMDRTNVDYKPYFVTDSAFLKMTLMISGMPDSNTIYKIRTVMRLTLSGD